MQAGSADMSHRGPGKITAAASAGPLIAALLIACLIHLILILGVDSGLPRTDSEARPMRPLEILVLRQAGPSYEKPAAIDPFPQVGHTAGNGKSSLDPVLEIPRIEPRLTTEKSLPAPALLPSVNPTGSRSPEQSMDTAFFAAPESEPESRPTLAPKLPDTPSPESKPPRIDAAGILASRNLEIAERAAKARHNSAASANRPRRKAIDASTREYHYADYLEAWRRKVERVGNLNYPEAAKRRKMYGSLVLHVAIRADGSLEQVRVLRSSGFDPLDQAAVRIVELAAPFSPLPPAIRTETDVLDITRTWQFLSNNRLGWER